MRRGIFIAGTIASLAAVPSARRPVLARAVSGVGSPVIRRYRHGIWGATPGGCADRRRRSSIHGGYTRADALGRFAR